MAEETKITEAEAIAKLARNAAEPRVMHLERGSVSKLSVLLKPQNMTVESLKPLMDEYLTAPERRKGTAKLADLGSFIAHAKRFSDADSALFADPNPAAPMLTAVIDYHPSGYGSAPRFGQHRGIYAFPVSDEWKAWTEKSGKKMTQADFSSWLEDHLTDVSEPEDAGEFAGAFAAKLGVSFATPGRLLELSRGLQVRIGSTVKNTAKLESGEANIQFVTEHQGADGQPLRIPGAFLVTLPVFQSGAAYEVAARLRYRVEGGAISWWYDLHRTDRIFRHAFSEAVEQARKETKLPVFAGAPE